ncbi:MAG: leishmanolysin-related zinc metalloendopeptidase, partial [Gemmatimonas sp.]
VDGLSPTVFTATALPGALATVALATVDNQVATVNTDVPAAPAVRAEDQFGNVIPGLPVTFAVTLGNGSVTGANQTTNAQGVATAGGWRLGTQAGAQRLRATVVDALNGFTTSVDASAVAQPGPAVDLIKIAGDNQVGSFGNAVPVPPGVRVVDIFGNGVGNVPVTFTPGPASGTVASAQQTSDPANGTAFVGAWILGPTEPRQTLVASSSALPGRAVSFTATVSTSQFDIDVRFIGTVNNPVVRQAFLTAAAKWRTIIVGNLQDTRVVEGAGECASWIPAVNEVINDVVIYARVAPIDGAGDSTGNILGQAGPCAVNTRTWLTTYGLMEFDEFDLNALVAEGLLTDVIVHEMGHVLGIGTLWDVQRTLLVGEGGNDPYFQGAGARTQFTRLNRAVYSGTPVPVENSGGIGTRDSHWRESILRNELMTGFLNRSSNPLSALSVGSLQDLGYTVNLAAAEGFSFAAALYRFPVEQSSRRLHNDVKRLPLKGFDERGRVTRLRQ